MKHLGSIDKILRFRWIYHIGFWALSFLILFKVFTKDYQNGTADIVYTLLFHLPLVILVYTNRASLSKWVLTKNYGYYFIVMLTLVGVCLAFHFLIFEFLSDYIFPGFYFISYYSAWSIIQFLMCYWIISSLLLLSVNWFELKDRQIKLEKESSRVRMDALKAQLNPHFLFNSLNNIYSLASANDPTVKDYLMKLSDALRYMLYETNEDFVLLENEINYLKDYVGLEKLRLDNPEQAEITVQGDSSGHLIAPLILLPLVENCFKHVHKMNPLIHIRLEIEPGGRLTCKTLNSIGDYKLQGGVGLQNLRSRLELIYPDKYVLDMGSEMNRFSAELTINLGHED